MTYSGGQRNLVSADADWKSAFASWLTIGSGRIHFLGVGNPIRGDDALGLELVRKLKKELGRAPSDIRVHTPSSSPEREMTRVPSGDRMVIFDAVESNRAPGSVLCARLSDTRYGFFATHNVPLKLIPGLAGREDSILMIGIQPMSMDVGEGLTPKVMESVDAVAAEVASAIARRSR